jgi:hypothetical protein
MILHRLLIAERRREPAARIAAGCCRQPRAARATPARHLRLPIASRTTAPACC